MKTQKNHSIKERHSFLFILLAFILISLLMGIACFRYYSQLQKTVKEESSGYLQEISKLLGDNTSRIINDNFSMLGTISMVLKDSGANQFEQLQMVSLNHQDYWEYEHLYLVDAKGMAYDSLGHSIALGNESFLCDVIVGGSPSMSSTVVIDGKDSVIFAIPINKLTLDGVSICAIAASYDLSTFDQILSMTAFNEEAYAHIVNRDGSVVIRSSSKNADQSGYNIINSLSEAKMGKDSNFETLKEDIAAGRSGMVTYTLNGVRKYMAYAPLASEEWRLLTFVPVAVVNAKSEILLHITLILCSFIMLLFFTLLAFLAGSFYKHKRSLEKIAYVDPVTGGNTIQKFYEETKKKLESSDDTPYAMIYMNIEKFKLLNEHFGKKACDELLCAIHRGITSDLKDNECIGRQYADNFCILVQWESEEALTRRFHLWKDESTRFFQMQNSVWIP
ncbi:MAG: diguanylate cyclase, partial [Acetivibrio sp.]